MIFRVRSSLTRLSHEVPRGDRGTNRAMRRSTRARLIALCLTAACSRRVPSTGLPSLPSEESGDSPERPAFAQRTSEIAPLFAGGLGERYVLKALALPPVKRRIVYRDRGAVHTWSAGEAMKQSDSQSLMPVAVSVDTFYARACGTPFEDARALDLVAPPGLTDLTSKRALVLGCVAMSELWMLASLGADAVGVDPDPEIVALYTGAPLPFSPNVSGGGRVTFTPSRFFSDPAARSSIGGGFALVVSRNTLSRGRVHPTRPAPARIDLGMDDDAFARSLFDALAPGGRAILYNTGVAPPGAPLLPENDLRSAFDRATWERAGFVDHDSDRLRDRRRHVEHHERIGRQLRKLVVHRGGHATRRRLRRRRPKRRRAHGPERMGLDPDRVQQRQWHLARHQSAGPERLRRLVGHGGRGSRRGRLQSRR
jgi:SAM-dependent methyltransferase